MTENHSYNVPEQGTSDWHRPLNENFRDIDTDVEIRDSEENLREYEPKEGAKFFASNTEAVFLGDGSEWRKVQSAGQSPSVESLRSKTVNDVVYAAAFPGSDLSTKVENALASLEETPARIRITPKADGSNWEWASSVTLDPTEYGGIEIEVDEHVTIEYSGGDYALTLSGVGKTSEQVQEGKFVSIRGGKWRSTGDDPNGCFRLVDIYQARLHPNLIQGFTNASGDAAGITVENRREWSEGTRIRGTIDFCDIGIDFKPASVTGGSGTESFMDTYLEYVRLLSVKEIGVRFRGAHISTTVLNPVVMFDAPDSTGLLFDGAMTGMTVVGPRFDNTATYQNTVAMEAGTEMADWNGPLVVQPYVANNVGTKYKYSTEYQVIPVINSRSGPFAGLGCGGQSQLRVFRDQVQFVDGDGDTVFKVDDEGTVFGNKFKQM